MSRVRRKLPREDVQKLRDALQACVPAEQADIASILRTMRAVTRLSQAEYARLCDVSPRIYAAVEAGKGSPTVDTLQKLLKPFGFSVGVVVPKVDGPPYFASTGALAQSLSPVSARTTEDPLTVRVPLRAP